MNSFLKSNVKLKTSIGFILAFIAYISVQILSNQSINRLNASQKQMLNSNLLAKQIGIIEVSIVLYENKITSFILTGNKLLLKGSEEHIKDAAIHLQNLKNYKVSLNQSALIQQLDSLVSTVFYTSQQALITYNIADPSEAISLINTGKGKEVLDEIYFTCATILQNEELNLANLIMFNKTISNNVVFLDFAATSFAMTVILFSLIMLFRYINKHTRIERQLRIAQQKAEQSAVMKEQFMANMSHEIRTPMNAIIGFSNLLAHSSLDEKQQKQIKAIQSSGEILLTIINDILDFSKIEEGRMNIEEIEFNPYELLHSINIMFLPKANDQNLQLDFYTSGNLPPVLIGDPTRLTQILVNLINNALKFTKEGNILVKTEIVADKNDTVQIQYTVKDTGIGIPKNKLQDIFERFTQANTDTNRTYGGSGLGLSITKKLVEFQGGNIQVHSAVGVGTSFTFTLPHKKATVKVISLPQSYEESVAEIPISILVAEDNLLNQQLIEELLNQWKIKFDLVENGLYAIAKLKQNKYDIILMDIQMPELDGYEATGIIRSELNIQTPIIAMTAHVLPGEVTKCQRYGMTDYISKPIRESELFGIIKKYSQITNPETNVHPNLTHTMDDTVKVINLDYLKELSNGNTQFITKMINIFLIENPKDITQLEESIHEANFKAISSIAHKIKSSLPFVGLNITIGEEISTIEKLANQQLGLSEIEQLFEKVKNACTLAVYELENYENATLEEIP